MVEYELPSTMVEVDPGIRHQTWGSLDIGLSDSRIMRKARHPLYGILLQQDTQNKNVSIQKSGE